MTGIFNGLHANAAVAQHDAHARGPGRHGLSALSIEVALLFGLAAGLTLPARADDGQGPATRLAAVGERASVPISRLGVPPRPADLDIDLRVLLADRSPSVKLETAPADDTILVAFAVDVPAAIEEDIAQQYGLELIEQTELPELGLRIAQYRGTGNRPISAVLSELRHDQRVRKAQRNVLHTLPETNPPAVASVDEKAPPSSQPKPPREASPKTPPRNSVPPPPMRAMPKQVDRPVVAAQAAPSARVGGVGDVMAGGL